MKYENLQSYRHICAICNCPFTSSAEGWLGHKKNNGSNDLKQDADHEPEYSEASIPSNDFIHKGDKNES